MCSVKPFDSLITAPHYNLTTNANTYINNHAKVMRFYLFSSNSSLRLSIQCWYINALRQIEPYMQRFIDWCLSPTYYHYDMILLQSNLCSPPCHMIISYYHYDMILLHSNLCSPPCHMIIYFLKNTMKNSSVLKHHYICWQIRNNLLCFH